MTAALIETVDPLLEPGWDQLVAASPYGGLFSSRAWLAALADGYGLRPQALIERSATGALVAAVPYCHINDAAGDRVRALPFSDYCDPLGADDALASRVQPLVELGLPFTMRVLHHRGARAGQWPMTDTAAWHAVDLTPGAEAVLAVRRGTARRNALRAERLGVKVTVASDLADVQNFHRMHAALRKQKYRMLAQPLDFFEAIHRQFAPTGNIAMLRAELDGELIAGILALFWRDRMYYKFNASYDTAARPNDLLMERAIGLGASRGCTQLDLGLSDLDQPGLLSFKEKFASCRAAISTVTITPAKPNAAEGSFRDTLQELTRVLTEPEVPESTCRRAGAVLYRFFA